MLIAESEKDNVYYAVYKSSCVTSEARRMYRFDRMEEKAAQV